MDKFARMMDIPANVTQYHGMSTHEMHFISQQDIREVLDHFSRLLAVRFCFLAADGRELQVGENKSHCRFCRLVRTSLGLAGQCNECAPAAA